LNAELDALEQEKLDAELSQLDARAAQCKTRSIFVHVNYTIANNNKNSHMLLFVLLLTCCFCSARLEGPRGSARTTLEATSGGRSGLQSTRRRARVQLGAFEGAV
jgi:hypothetical protein